ncbi:MAG: DHHA1 domain-containing protein [Anaerolineae bacterium]
MNNEVTLLLETVRQFPQVLILPHNDPDPDAIASAVALRYLLAGLTPAEVEVGYRGIIGRAENRALARYLDYPLVSLGKTVPLGRPVILVDTQPGTGNNPWHPEMRLAGVIDHHPFRPESDAAAFVAVSPDMGATATIIYGYFTAAGMPLPAPLATALFYGIKTDTRGLSRGVSPADAEAYFQLQSQVDSDALAEIERAQVPVSYFKSFANALEKTRLLNDVAVSHVGPMEYPDMAAEMADLLVRLENVTWVVCTGIYKNRLFLAVRAPGGNGDAGALVRKIVRENGTAGGHDTMAGGQIPIHNNDPAQMVSLIEQRLYQALKLDASTPAQRLV